MNESINQSINVQIAILNLADLTSFIIIIHQQTNRSTKNKKFRHHHRHHEDDEEDVSRSRTQKDTWGLGGHHRYKYNNNTTIKLSQSPCRDTSG
jgi:hypothetical protein